MHAFLLATTIPWGQGTVCFSKRGTSYTSTIGTDTVRLSARVSIKGARPIGPSAAAPPPFSRSPLHDRDETRLRKPDQIAAVAITKTCGVDSQRQESYAELPSLA